MKTKHDVDRKQSYKQCSRKRVQEFKKNKKACFLDFEKNVRKSKNVHVCSFKNDLITQVVNT